MSTVIFFFFWSVLVPNHHPFLLFLQFLLAYPNLNNSFSFILDDSFWIQFLLFNRSPWVTFIYLNSNLRIHLLFENGFSFAFAFMSPWVLRCNFSPTPPEFMRKIPRRVSFPAKQSVPNIFPPSVLLMAGSQIRVSFTLSVLVYYQTSYTANRSGTDADQAVTYIDAAKHVYILHQKFTMLPS